MNGASQRCYIGVMASTTPGIEKGGLNKECERLTVVVLWRASYKAVCSFNPGVYIF